MTDYKIYSYQAFRQHVHDDERKVERTSLALLNAETLQVFLDRMKEERPGFSKLTEKPRSKNQKYVAAISGNTGLTKWEKRKNSAYTNWETA